MSAIVDWCTATFAFAGEEQFPALLHALRFASGLELTAVERRKQNGFRDGLVVHAWIDGEFVELCVVCWGGEAQRGRAMVNVSGRSCGVIADWQAFRDLLESLPESKLTRVDVAVDVMDGRVGVDEAMGWSSQGRFNCNGRPPSTRVDGDWLPVLQGTGESRAGRTLYIGKASNGKGLRVYEKGKQLGDATSEWNRFEVQFGSRDRVIPFEMLTEPTKYFVAAYPALEEVVVAAGERVRTISKTAEITLGRILTWMRDSAGKWLHVMCEAGIDSAELVEELRVRAVPKRVQPSAVAAGATRGAFQTAFDRWRQ